MTTTALLPLASDAYAAATATLNTRIRHTPAAVVSATTEIELAAAVRSAAERGLRVAVRSTGHGLWPIQDDTVLIDVSAMDTITIDPATRSATVGPGARWKDILALAAGHGLGGLAGSSPTVGAVGFHLGGGLGPISRAYGYAADHVQSLRAVTADGTIIEVSAHQNPDLFWAMRGGGALAIVTSLTFALVPGRLRGGGVYFRADDAQKVLHRWRDWAEGLPDEVSTSAAVIDLPPLGHIPEPIRGQRVLHLRYADVGESHADPAVLSFGTPVWGGIDELSFDRLGEIHAEPTNAKPTIQDSALLHGLSPETLESFIESSLDDSLGLTVRELRLLGGAMSAPQRSADAVAARDAGYLLFALGDTPPQREEVVSRGLDRFLSATVPPHAPARVLASFAGEGRPGGRIEQAWDADTLDRLRAIRSAVDPQGTFAPNLRWV